MLKRVLFWLAVTVMTIGIGSSAFDWPRPGRPAAWMGILGVLATLYVLHVTHQSVERKSQDAREKILGELEAAELSLLAEHIDTLDQAIQAEDGDLIVEARESIFDLVTELQAHRRTRR